MTEENHSPPYSVEDNVFSYLFFRWATALENRSGSQFIRGAAIDVCGMYSPKKHQSSLRCVGGVKQWSGTIPKMVPEEVAPRIEKVYRAALKEMNDYDVAYKKTIDFINAVHMKLTGVMWKEENAPVGEEPKKQGKAPLIKKCCCNL